nr:DNA-directed DNA polymerase [Tanacetum cinerariifolium]
MPVSVWNKLSLPDLSPTCMTLELVDHSISRPVGVAKDVYVKVGTFHFQADFVVVDFNANPRVPLILEISFLKTERALIDVFEGELTLRVGKEAITFNLDQLQDTQPITMIRRKTVLTSLTWHVKSIQVDLFLALEDDPTSPEGGQSYLDSEGDILLLEAFMNTKSDKSSIDEPSEVKLKDLPPHLEYAFLEGDDKGIDIEFCTHKILMEEEFEPTVQHQRRVNPKIYDVIKQEVLKLLDAGLIYPISDSPWVSPIHCVPKKGGFTVVENKENEVNFDSFGHEMACLHRIS